MRLARVSVTDPARFQRHFAPIFQGTTMRSLRIELTPEAMRREQLPAMYAHLVAEAADSSGFAVLRDLLRSIQRGRIADALKHACRIPKVAPELLRLIYSRLIQKRLMFPNGANLYLHIDFEQAPSFENRVYLGKPDASGRRIVHIDWDIREDTQRIAVGAQAAIEALWHANGFDRQAHLDFFAPAKDIDWLVNIYDIYHPAGTTRMSVDPAAGVVDTNLRIHGTCNVFVAGTSVFPSMGAANPTFTAMALALRLAKFVHASSPSDLAPAKDQHKN
jgi:choline dehydrogenase-like flavoprotein